MLGVKYLKDWLCTLSNVILLTLYMSPVLIGQVDLVLYLGLWNFVLIGVMATIVDEDLTNTHVHIHDLKDFCDVNE